MRQRISLASSTLALGLVLGLAQFGTAVPAKAGIYNDGGGGGADGRDWGADHDEVYQVQRGDLVCNSREACGGAAAIPMNRPGWFYLPGGIYAAQRAAAAAPPVPRRHKHRR